jgi:hypothetical protein
MCTELIPYLNDASREGNIAFLPKDKLAVNRKIYEMAYLQQTFHMESEKQIRDKPTDVKNRKMNQCLIQTQSHEIPQKKWVGKEVGETIERNSKPNFRRLK